MTSDRPLPLAGIRVLDFGHIVAGPFCVRMLADLGADVVKVETATRQGRTGARRGGARRGSGNTSGRTPVLWHVNRNRRSIDLNLKTERGLDFARKLVDTADVLVENFSSGVMDRLGLGYDTLSQSNPRLVCCSMSAFGHTGPRRGWTGMNVTLQACSGLMLATGAPNDPPIGISNSWNDYIGGLHAAAAIVGALAERQKTGRGRHLDVSQFECSVAMVGSLLLASAVSGKPPERLGSRSHSAAPQGCYRCAGRDQWCTLSIETDAQWRALLAVLGDAAMALREPAYASLSGRLAHQDAIDAAIERWIRTLSPDDAERKLAEAGVPAAAMRRGNEIAHVEEWRRLLRSVDGSDEDSRKVVGLPFVFQGSAPAAAVAAPRVGEHSAEVLRDWLKLDDAAIADFVVAVPA